jgi:hypothetical protein
VTEHVLLPAVNVAFVPRPQQGDLSLRSAVARSGECGAARVQFLYVQQ